MLRWLGPRHTLSPNAHQTHTRHLNNHHHWSLVMRQYGNDNRNEKRQLQHKHRNATSTNKTVNCHYGIDTVSIYLKNRRKIFVTLFIDR